MFLPSGPLEKVRFRTNLQRFRRMLSLASSDSVLIECAARSFFKGGQSSWTQESLIISLEWLARDETPCGKALYAIGRMLLDSGKMSVQTEHHQTALDLDGPISQIDPSARVENCLVGYGINTIRELVNLNPRELRRIKNFGRTCLTEVEMKLQFHGLLLRGEKAVEENRA